MSLSLIVAMTRDGIIGVENKLPWHIPRDLKRFKELTTGHSIVMGRKTWESIGRMLPNRENIVVTRNPNLNVSDGVLKASSLSEALAKCTHPRVFVIGGASLFEEALPMAQTLYITWVERPFLGDVRLNLDLKGFCVDSNENYSDPFDYSFTNYSRTNIENL